LPGYEIDQDAVMPLVEQVAQAARNAIIKCKTEDESRSKSKAGKKRKKF
jgi:hypothetical protein